MAGLNGVTAVLVNYNLVTPVFYPWRIQQGDPMGPLLFSLVLCKLLREVKENNFSSSDSLFDLWYLDDGTIIGNRVDVAKFYEGLSQGPSFGLYVNPQNVNCFGLLGISYFTGLMSLSYAFITVLVY